MPSQQQDEPHRPSTDIAEVLRVLDECQSLLVMLTLVGPDPEAWKAEGMMRLIEEQACENRRVLGPPAS